MRLLEYQAKELFAEYGIRIPQGKPSTDIDQARRDAYDIGYPVVIKSQVPVGGRGKAGGIQICNDMSDLETKYPQIMNMSIKSEKTRAILLEKTANIKQELYLSLFLNRSRRCYTIIASAEGGVEIESQKDQIIIDVGAGNVTAEVALDVATRMGLSGKATHGLTDMLIRLAKLAAEKEAELAEINPLAILDDDSVMALDGKVMTDDNSSFRHPEMTKYRDVSELEETAERSGFSLVELGGDIAVVGNGAGLVMSTLDMLHDGGGRPACFLDVGGGATTESVYTALTLISQMTGVKTILINLYGGIVKTTTVASAFIMAYGNGIIDVPVHARLMGAESDKAKEMLAGTRTVLHDTVEDAISAAVREIE